MLYDPNDPNANLVKTMNANEIVILWADAPEHVTVAAMMELPLKWMTTAQIVPIKEMTALNTTTTTKIPTILVTTTTTITKIPILIPNPIPIPNLIPIITIIIVNKSASEQSMDVATTACQ
jgi:hypothetical protein